MKAVNCSSKTEFNSYINFYDGKSDENFSIMLRSIVRMLFTPAQFISVSHKDIKFCERTKHLPVAVLSLHVWKVPICFIFASMASNERLIR